VLPILIVRVVTPCSLVGCYRRLEEMLSVYLHLSRICSHFSQRYVNRALKTTKDKTEDKKHESLLSLEPHFIQIIYLSLRISFTVVNDCR
jgi:hypothetical protein